MGERFTEVDRELVDLLVKVYSHPAPGSGCFDHDPATVGLIGSALHEHSPLESVDAVTHDRRGDQQGGRFQGFAGRRPEMDGIEILLTPKEDYVDVMGSGRSTALASTKPTVGFPVSREGIT